MKYYCLTSVYRDDLHDCYYLDERSFFASSDCTLVGVRTGKRLHIQNVWLKALPQASIIVDSHRRWFIEMLKLFVVDRRSKFVIADHSRFPIVLELIGRMFNNEIIRYCGSDMIKAALLREGLKKYLGFCYALLNEVSLAQKVICNNSRSFRFHFRYRRAYIINSAIMPIDYRLEELVFDVIFVGGLEKRKGILEFLRDLEKVKDRLKVGLIGDGNLKDEVRERISKSVHDVHMLGNIDKVDVYDTMSKSGALYLQSGGEGFPRAITEALCFDLIVFTNQSFPGTRRIDEFVLWNFLENRNRSRIYNGCFATNSQQYLSELYA